MDSDLLQQDVQTLLDGFIASGEDCGCQAAVYHGGKLVADAWAGVTDAAGTTPVDGDTLFPVFSVSKGVTATIVARLVERGLLDYGAPIAEYWPEYGCKGKEAITLAQVLSHRAGMPQMPMHLRVPDLGDWGKVCAALADLEPLWEPGSKYEYHAMSYGWLAGEPACRVTGKDFPTLIEEEIKQPLGLEHLYIGCPNAGDYDVAVLEDPMVPSEFPETDRPESIPWWTQPLFDMMNRDDARAACMPGASGIMTARSIARMYAALAPGGVDGVSLVSQDILRQATTPMPMPDGTVPQHALGYLLFSLAPNWRIDTPAYGHGGHGGSFAFYDPELDLAIGFFHNRLTRPEQVPECSPKRFLDLVRSHVRG